MPPEPADYRTISESDVWQSQIVPVSAVLITYRQEEFVQAALESLLAQTYPLDIVISDDASPDRTFAVMEQILDGYTGPHRIRIRRSGRNQGICRNQNSALSLAEGELIVLFEGDDISLPNRVSALVDCYVSSDRNLGALGSLVTRIDPEGKFIGEVPHSLSRGDAISVKDGLWTVVGCGLALRRDCFFDIGPITFGLISGDIAIWTRSVFLRNGGMACVQRSLVDYRVHPANTSKGYRLNFSSRAFLREACRRLLRNEVAQVIELKKIMRYRRANSLADPRIDRAWAILFDLAVSRARMILAVARYPVWKWMVPATVALRHASLRGQGLRVITLALFPFASRIRSAGLSR